MDRWRRSLLNHKNHSVFPHNPLSHKIEPRHQPGRINRSPTLFLHVQEKYGPYSELGSHPDRYDQRHNNIVAHPNQKVHGAPNISYRYFKVGFCLILILQKCLEALVNQLLHDRLIKFRESQFQIGCLFLCRRRPLMAF